MGFWCWALQRSKHSLRRPWVCACGCPKACGFVSLRSNQNLQCREVLWFAPEAFCTAVCLLSAPHSLQNQSSLNSYSFRLGRWLRRRSPGHTAWGPEFESPEPLSVLDVVTVCLYSQHSYGEMGGSDRRIPRSLLASQMDKCRGKTIRETFLQTT